MRWLILLTLICGSEGWILKERSCSKGLVFMTDLEGELEYTERVVLRYLEKGVFSVDGSGEPFSLKRHYESLRMNEGWCVAFGGDNADKGIGSLRIVSMAVKLKKLFPEQVMLISGNREYNKLRYFCELRYRKNLPANFRPYRRNFRGFESMTQAQIESHKQMFAHLFPGEARKEDIDEFVWLCWHSTEVMGMLPLMFSSRMAELEELKGAKVEFREFMHSFWAQIDTRLTSEIWFPKLFGRMWDYILLSTPAGIFELNSKDQVIIAHGGVSIENWLVIPSIPPSRAHSVQHWIKATADMYSRHLKKFELEKVELVSSSCNNVKEGITEPLYNYIPYSALDTLYSGDPVDYFVTTRGHLDGRNNEAELEHDLVEFMRAEKVIGVFVGHTPRGPYPSVIVTSGIFYLDGDTSEYRNLDSWATVVFRPSTKKLEIEGHGLVDYSMSSDHPLFGTHDNEGFWVRGIAKDGNAILCKGDLVEEINRRLYSVACKEAKLVNIQTVDNPQGTPPSQSPPLEPNGAPQDGSKPDSVAPQIEFRPENVAEDDERMRREDRNQFRLGFGPKLF